MQVIQNLEEAMADRTQKSSPRRVIQGLHSSKIGDIFLRKLKCPLQYIQEKDEKV